MAATTPQGHRRSILHPSEMVARMRWSGARAQLGATGEPTTTARLLAWLFGSGALLLLVTLLLPGAPGRNSGAMSVVVGAALLVALLYLAVYDRTPRWALVLGPALGSLMIAVVVYDAGSTASAAYGMLVVWVVLAAAPFFSLRVTIAHAIFAVLAYGAAMIATPGTAQLVGLKLTMAAGTLVVGSLVIGGLASQLRNLVDRLADAARTDPLTGLFNRRALDEAFDIELARSRRTRSAVALVTIDLDHFKEFNDRRGHPAGDTILQRLAGVLSDTTRNVDVTARIGGEEFAVLAPETGVPGGLALAERLRRAIEVEFSGETPKLTASLGVAGAPAHGSDRMRLMKAADRALYEAKQGGRNRAVVTSIDPDQPKPERRVGDLVG